MNHISQTDIVGMDKTFRTNFVNSLSGFKSLQLVGTKSKAGLSNLAPINSLVHLGANPALLGMIMRPDTVARHTLENIMETEFWTLNNIREEYYVQAHQCAARYDRQTSEFEATNLTECFGSILAPYLQEASVQIGLKLTERIDIQCNNTHMIIGEIVEVFIDSKFIEHDGTVNHENAGSLTVAGLDSYHKTKKLSRLSYPKGGTLPHDLL
jgi:flavin reductase (DIM6/NTAB) family NADH-FMN oxidoreductase RutF